MRVSTSSLITATFLSVSTLTHAIHLTADRLSKVHDLMISLSAASWENGTKAQAILESDYASLSVFSSSAFPLPNPLPTGDIGPILDIAQVTMNNRPASNTSAAAMGGSSLLEDGSSGDPASLGIAVMLADASTGNQQIKGVGYGDAATSELNYLLYDVPKASDGAISHRADQVQLWADNIYMVPPFLAYYGVVHNNQSLVQAAYMQCLLYRAALRQSSGLWAHIKGGNGAIAEDPGLWATGNAWAAAGMLRVWATIAHSTFAGNMACQMNDLQTWITEILNGAQGQVSGNGLLHNYIDQSDTFEDSSGSALIAATGFRLSTLNLTNSFVDLSITLLSSVSAKVNSTGYVTQVVNPYNFGQQGAVSPEAQSFVVMAYAAYNEWDQAGRPGKGPSSDDPLGSDSGAMMVKASASVVPGVAVALAWSMW